MAVMPATSHLGLVPHARTDETLSSFILRFARNQSAIPHELCAMVWPGLEFWPRDIDRTASDLLVKAVADVCGLPFSEVKAMTLHGLVDGMGYPSTSTGIQWGILPVGVYHRKRRRFGQQYCPQCLKENPAYLRRLWRLEFVSACQAHGCRLMDACPHCDTPFVPHRMDSLLDRQCHHCQGLLTKVASKPANPQALQLQTGFAALLYEQVGSSQSLGRSFGIHANRREFFDGVRRLCRLLTYSADGNGLKPRRVGLRWGYLRVEQRELVLSHVGEWLNDWPGSFQRWAEKFKVSQERINVAGPWPQWVAAEIACCCSRPHRMKRRPGISLQILKKEYGNTVAYRMARAKLLLDRAGVRGG